MVLVVKFEAALGSREVEELEYGSLVVVDEP